MGIGSKLEIQIQPSIRQGDDKVNAEPPTVKYSNPWIAEFFPCDSSPVVSSGYYP